MAAVRAGGRRVRWPTWPRMAMLARPRLRTAAWLPPACRARRPRPCAARTSLRSHRRCGRPAGSGSLPTGSRAARRAARTSDPAPSRWSQSAAGRTGTRASCPARYRIAGGDALEVISQLLALATAGGETSALKAQPRSRYHRPRWLRRTCRRAKAPENPPIRLRFRTPPCTTIPPRAAIATSRPRPLGSSAASLSSLLKHPSTHQGCACRASRHAKATFDRLLAQVRFPA